MWSPPPAPEKPRRINTIGILAVVSVIVIIIGVVGFVLLGGLTLFRQPSNLPKPNVLITNTHGVYSETDCGNTNALSNFLLNATLINNGLTGYAKIGFYINELSVKNVTYLLNMGSQLPISEIFTLHSCYGTTHPTYAIVLLDEWPV